MCQNGVCQGLCMCASCNRFCSKALLLCASVQIHTRWHQRACSGVGGTFKASYRCVCAGMQGVGMHAGSPLLVGHGYS